MADKADITIIGAGVVGLAIAAAVAREGREVYILEKNDTFGKDQSSRSAEVIHAGLNYATDSLKAKLCVEGNHLLYALCAKNGVAHTRCGKILMATNAAEDAQLEKVFRQGQTNGAPLEMLTAPEIHRLEPHLVATSAFFSPSTGIIDSHGLMKFFLGTAQDRGANLACKAEVITIEKVPDGYEVRVRGNPDYSFTTRVLINSAGLYSDRIAALAGIDTKTANCRIHLSKGEFYSVDGHKDKYINHLVYPVPMPNNLGIHVCFDIDRRLRLGPFFYWVDEIDYKMDDSRRSDFLNSSIMKALPLIEPSDLEPESAGIAAKLWNVPGAFSDFIIRHEHDRGLPGFIDLIGIDSPGLTSSPAIAKYVRRMVEDILGSKILGERP